VGGGLGGWLFLQNVILWWMPKNITLATEVVVIMQPPLSPMHIHVHEQHYLIVSRPMISWVSISVSCCYSVLKQRYELCVKNECRVCDPRRPNYFSLGSVFKYVDMSVATSVAYICGPLVAIFWHSHILHCSTSGFYIYKNKQMIWCNFDFLAKTEAAEAWCIHCCTLTNNLDYFWCD